MNDLLMTKKFLSAACVLPLLALTVAAQLDDPARDRDDSEDLPKRKGRSFFHRPAEHSPAAQLELARDLAEEGKTRAAANANQSLVHAWHSSPQAPEAQLALARLFEQRRRYARAFDEYEYLIDNFPGRFPFTEVIRAQYRIANQIMSARRGGFWRFKGFAFPDRALPLFEKIVRNAPESDVTPDAQYRVGLLYQQNKDFEAAITAFETLRYRYPGAPGAAEADFRRVECLHALARQNPRDETSCLDAITGLADFLRETAGREKGDEEHVARAREMLDDVKEQLARMYYERAVFYDRHRRRKPQAALIAYEDFLAKFPTSKLTDRVRARLGFLKENLELPDEK